LPDFCPLRLNMPYGVASIKGLYSTLSVGRLGLALAKRPEPTLGDPRIRMPVVVPGQVDVDPGQRKRVL